MTLLLIAASCAGCRACGRIDDGNDAGDGGGCKYSTKKYGRQTCPVSDGAYDFCGPQDDCNLDCYCWSDLTVHCTSDSCRLNDGGECCRHDW